MRLSEGAEEVLEALWTCEEKGSVLLSLKELGPLREGLLEELSRLHLIALSDGRMMLTDEGRKEAEAIIRRHRLAERLLVEVLDVKGRLIEEMACKFEHAIRDGVDESICILLGHPKICPHGRPIPMGRCCLSAEKKVERIVCPLAELKPGQRGRIAYIFTKEHGRLQKLMVMGALPGMSIILIQNFPSYVFQIEQTQIAVDRELAESIFVRLEK